MRRTRGRSGLLAVILGAGACAFALAQSGPALDWSLAPQLIRGQELVYTGWFTEKTLAPGVQHERTYRLDTTLFVLDSSPRKWDIAILTSLSLHANSAARPGDIKKDVAASVRLEVAEIDRQGRMLSKPGLFAVPLGGPPTLECGALVETPRGRDAWETAEDGRPARSWKMVGKEDVKGNACAKLVSVQQSDDWDSPRADQTAWRRRDTIWLLPQLGAAFRVERVIERRDPARREPTHQFTLQYELEGRPLSFRGQRFDDRSLEIQQARKYLDEAVVLIRQPAQYRSRIDATLKKISYHLGNHHPTPYRKALVQVQKRLQAAQRGETPAELATDMDTPLTPATALGQRVPDFVTTEVFRGKSVRLQHLLGRPVLLVFYKPHTETGVQTLRFAQSLSDQHRGQVTVVGMAVSDNSDFVRKQHADLRLSFTLLDGKGMHRTFGVDATPRLVLLDGDGVLRGAYTGWGAHTPGEIATELKKWLSK
jgi:peroxiredoxin